MFDLVSAPTEEIDALIADHRSFAETIAAMPDDKRRAYQHWYKHFGDMLARTRDNLPWSD